MRQMDGLKYFLFCILGLLVLYSSFRYSSGRADDTRLRDLASRVFFREALPRNTVIHACAGSGCLSYIEIAGQRLASVQRGVAVFIIGEKSEIRQLISLDHCTSGDVYAESPPIRELIESELSKDDSVTKSVLFLTSDTVNCDFAEAQMRAVEQWLEGTGLEEFARLQVREAYIGIVDPYTWKRFEVADSKSFNIRR